MKKVVVREDYPVVNTTCGKVRGLEIDDVMVFRGVPYARAERFMAPVKPEAWDDVRDCYVWGNACPVGDIMRSGIFCMHRQWEQDEDCLNLNVWTTSINSDARRPVMFWIHGGGYANSSSIEEYGMEGDRLAATDQVVVVSINHRLNYLGYLDLTGYGEEFADSANAGMLDILAALKWVRENIASFGGDPDNITLFGQSGGGGKIMTLMQMPAADGLYHKAIIQSGIMLMNDRLRNGKEHAEAVVSELGLSRDTIDQIKTVPYRELYEAGMRAAARDGIFIMDAFGPHPDGINVYDDYATAGFRKEVKDIPVMVGSCIGEMSAFSMHGQVRPPFGRTELEQYRPEEKTAFLKRYFGDHADEIMHLMQEAYPEIDPMYAPLIDTGIRRKTLEYVGARAEAADAPVFNYLMTYRVPFMEGKLSWHGADIPMVFGSVDRSEILSTGGEEAHALSRTMMNAFIAFACTGDPSAEDLPWPSYSTEHRNTMLFDNVSRSAKDHDTELIDAIRNAKLIKDFFD